MLGSYITENTTRIGYKINICNDVDDDDDNNNNNNNNNNFHAWIRSIDLIRHRRIAIVS